jgi:hypothetical protein
MNLYDETKALWTEERAALAARWAKELREGIPAVLEASKLFNEWKPLRFYVAVGDVSRAGRSGGASVSFSLRYRGQEVAKVTVGKEPKLVVTAKQMKTNSGYFKVTTPAGEFGWRSPEAVKFRREFKSPRLGAPVKSVEREVEARILVELEGDAAARKFAGTLRNVRHCGLTRHEYPVQYPVPISANTGRPRASRGNIDILARRGGGRGTRLSVWELKRPDALGAFQKALAQAYIYAVTLALMLRGDGGGEWYRLFGFRGPVPESLAVEAVAVVTEDQAKRAGAALESLGDSPLVLADERTGIGLHVAYYDEASLRMRWVPLTNK